MAIRPASLLAGLRARLSVNRPLAVLLSITTVLTSMNVVVGADPPAESGALERVRARGAQAALMRDGAGTIVPQRLADAEEADIAAKIAETLENGRRNGIFRITNDFRVTLTAKGRAFAEEAVAEMSHGCAAATSVGADWT